MSIGAVGGSSASYQIQRTQQQPPVQMKSKDAEEAAESPQQEDAEKGRVDIKA